MFLKIDLLYDYTTSEEKAPEAEEAAQDGAEAPSFTVPRVPVVHAAGEPRRGDESDIPNANAATPDTPVK